VNNRKVSFYYVSNDETIVPIRSNDIDDWKDFLKDNRIGHNTRKTAYEPSQRLAMVTPIPLDLPVEEGNHSENELHEAARQAAGPFWYDKRICKLFNTSDVESKLAEWIDKLKTAEFDEQKLSELVNKSGEHPLQTNHILNVQCKVMYLHRAYQFALDEMPDGKTWQDCCEKSIKVLRQVGID